MNRRILQPVLSSLTAFLLAVSGCQTVKKESPMTNREAPVKNRIKNVPSLLNVKIPKDHPGVRREFVDALLAVVGATGAEADPVWTMGTSAFAFRIIVHETLCDSATDWWQWIDIGSESLAQSGYACATMQHEGGGAKEVDQHRMAAHEGIVDSINKGVPVIVWDVSSFDWGVIVGYDNKKTSYSAISYGSGRPILCDVPYKKLGYNSLPMEKLTVLIPGAPNNRDKNEIILNSLRAAVEHAEGREWSERPRYENGLSAYEQWAKGLGHKRVGTDFDAAGWNKVASWNAAVNYSARCYARDYLGIIMGDNPDLKKAHLAYTKVARLLKPVWEAFRKRGKEKPSDDIIEGAVKRIRAAAKTEREAIKHIKSYLSKRGGEG